MAQPVLLVGPECYRESEGKSAGSTNSMVIPRIFHHVSRDVQALFCMAHCEQLQACVGFDLRTHENRIRCVFMDMGLLHHVSFDLYVRRC